MYLAEALAKRKKLVTQIIDLQTTATSNLWLSVGSEDEKPDLETIEDLRIQLRDLICAINLSNSLCGMTKLIAERDCLKAKIKCLTEVATGASSDTEARYNKGEKRVRTVNIDTVRVSLSQAQDKLVDLESEINVLNWKTELS